MSSGHHRWVVDEPAIPFDVGILYEDADIIVVDKPHFLPTTPRGMWYRQTALMRLRQRYHDDAITPAHRLDRATAGVVVFVRNPAMRGMFQMLFQNHETCKTYECIAPLAPIDEHRGGRSITGITDTLAPPRAFPLRRSSHITKLRGVIQAFEEPGVINAVTDIDVADCQEAAVQTAAVQTAAIQVAAVQTAASETEDNSAVEAPHIPLAPLGLRAYRLQPLTGKTHQLRVHMNALGLPMLGDDIYPRLIDRPYDDFSMPLQLVARELRFTDPRNGTPRIFRSRVPLAVPGEMLPMLSGGWLSSRRLPS